MRQHHALWLAGRSGGVNDSRQIVRTSAREQLFEHVWIVPIYRRAARFNLLQAGRPIQAFRALLIEHNNVRNRLDGFKRGPRVFQNSSAGNHQCARARIFENETNLIRRLRGVEWNGDGAHAQDGKIDDGPFRTVLGNQSDAIARVNSQIRQA